MALLTSGWTKCRADTGIDPFCSCTIAGDFMHVFRTSHLKEKTIVRILPHDYRSMQHYSNKWMGRMPYCEKITGVLYKDVWSVGEMYQQDAKLWADSYYESGHHKFVGAFLGCMYHGCPTCYDKQTLYTMLNNTMGDLYRKTKRWIKCVKTCGYMYSIMCECQWDKISKTDVKLMGHVDSYWLADVLNPRDALNTNVIIATYVTTHASLELYNYWERWEDHALYCDIERPTRPKRHSV